MQKKIFLSKDKIPSRRYPEQSPDHNLNNTFSASSSNFYNHSNEVNFTDYNNSSRSPRQNKNVTGGIINFYTKIVDNKRSSNNSNQNRKNQTNINNNINQILNKNQYRELIKIDEEIKKKISTKMEANEENCIFINYYDQGKNNKKCGTDDLFKVIKNQFELTESYKNKKKISELKANNFDEYMEKIIDESKEIRERAEIKLSSLITFTFTSILPFLQYGITKKDFSKISDTFGINFEQVSKELKTKRIDEEVLKKAKIDKLDFYDPEKSKTSIFENLFKHLDLSIAIAFVFIPAVRLYSLIPIAVNLTFAIKDSKTYKGDLKKILNLMQYYYIINYQNIENSYLESVNYLSERYEKEQKQYEYMIKNEYN